MDERERRARTARLAEARRAQGMSQRDLAERIGVGRRTVQSWEAGENVPQAAKLLKAECELGIVYDAEVPDLNSLPSEVYTILVAVATMLLAAEPEQRAAKGAAAVRAIAATE